MREVWSAIKRSRDRLHHSTIASVVIRHVRSLELFELTTFTNSRLAEFVPYSSTSGSRSSLRPVQRLAGEAWQF
jgi:hypothetical protein